MAFFNKNCWGDSMRRGFKCRNDILQRLKERYDQTVLTIYKGDYLKAVERFEEIAEGTLRNELSFFYSNQRSCDQAWKTCKGTVYEYAVFKCIQQEIKGTGKKVLFGDEVLQQHKDQIVIHNWSDIFPDADILILKKDKVVAIVSCKTSLRERLTETAFWKRELERFDQNIKLILVTTDKDNELRNDTNRYILLHVMDCTFVTDPEKYEQLLEVYKKRYGKRRDFQKLLARVKPIADIGKFLAYL